ncbi:MAG: sulfate permease [Thermoleophilia bacterium]|nr:sulfate permease [Thermoleophilia bacterium]
MPSGVRLLGWARPYSTGKLRADLLAGLTMAAIVVPQAMAYALLAGLPPEAGLYAATLPVVVYAVLGTSLHLSVGPVALVSLLTLTALSNSAPPGRELETAGLLALLVGAAHVLLGFARLGFLVNYISRPVLVGFIAAAAVIIAASQLSALTGVDAERAESFTEIIDQFVSNLSTINWATLTLGVAAVAFLLVWRRRRRGVPGPLLVAVSATLVVALASLDQRRGVDVVGEIPSGLPQPALEGLTVGLALELLPAAIVITLVGYLESIVIAKTYAQRLDYRLRPNQEMVALGFSNAGAGVVGGYPVSGSFSRTAANVQAGAHTPLSGLVAAGIVLVVLVALTPLLEPLPDAALAAIIIVAVSSLIDLDAVRRIWALHRRDFVMLALAFLLTLGLGVEVGLVLAVAISLATLGTAGLRSRVVNTSSGLPSSVASVRIDGPLTFANQRGLRRALARIVDERGDGTLRAVVVDLSRARDVDLSAAQALSDLVDDYAESFIRVHLAAPNDRVLHLLEGSGLWAGLGSAAHLEVSTARRSAVSESGRADSPRGGGS